MRTLIFLFLTLMITGCTIFKKNSSVRVVFNELGYGICETTPIEIQNSKTSPSGNHRVSSGFSLIKQTDRIPGKIGLQFGVEYILESDANKEITLEQVWILPSIIRDDNGRKYKKISYKTKKSTNYRTNTNYIFEKEYEIVKGEWIYQMFHEGKKVYERKFYIE